jgi:hypothetical protein
LLVELLGTLLRRVPVHADVHQPVDDGPGGRAAGRIDPGGNRDARELARRRRVEADGEVLVRFAHPVLVLEAQPVVQRELRMHAPVVLPVAAVVVRVDVERRRQHHRALARRVGARVAEQEARDGVAVGGAVVGAGRRRELLVELERAGAGSGRDEVHADAPVVGAHLEQRCTTGCRKGCVRECECFQ